MSAETKNLGALVRVAVIRAAVIRAAVIRAAVIRIAVCVGVFGLAVGAPTASANLLDKAKNLGHKVVEKGKEVLSGGKKEATKETEKVTKKVEEVVVKGVGVLKDTFSADNLKELATKLANVITNGKTTIIANLIKAYDKAKEFAGKKVSEFTKSDTWTKIKSAYKTFRAKIDPMVSLAKTLVKDKAAKERIAKLIRHAADGTFSDEDRDTANWLGTEIRKVKTAEFMLRREAVGLCAEAPSFKSFAFTFGIAITGISPWVVGANIEGRWGIVADFDGPGKVKDLRAYWHLEGGIGAGTGPGGEAAANLMISLSAMPTENAPGGFFGVFAEAGAPLSEAGVGIGAEVEIEWGFAEGKLYPWPGFGFGLGAAVTNEAGAAVMLSGGYAFTINAKGTQY